MTIDNIRSASTIKIVRYTFSSSHTIEYFKNKKKVMDNGSPFQHGESTFFFFLSLYICIRIRRKKSSWFVSSGEDNFCFLFLSIRRKRREWEREREEQRETFSSLLSDSIIDSNFLLFILLSKLVLYTFWKAH